MLPETRRETSGRTERTMDPRTESPTGGHRAAAIPPHLAFDLMDAWGGQRGKDSGPQVFLESWRDAGWALRNLEPKTGSDFVARGLHLGCPPKVGGAAEGFLTSAPRV